MQACERAHLYARTQKPQEARSKAQREKMMPQAVQLTIPVWAQAILALTAILANVGTFAFVIFVLWPSIRNQERRAEKLEVWIGGSEGQRIKAAVISRIDKADGLGTAGKPVDRDLWAGSNSPPAQTEDGERSDL